MEQVIAVVPIRSFEQGKTRLAKAITQAERAALVRRMADRVTRELSLTRNVTPILVVSPDPDVLAWATSLSPAIVPLAQLDQKPGLDAAIEIGRQWARNTAADAMLSLFADLPLVAASDVEDLLASPAEVVLGSDRRGTGTNALLLRLNGRGSEFRFAFGAGSMARHLAEAQRIGMSVEVRKIAGIAFDLDTAEDLADLQARSGDDEVLGKQRMECGASAR
jgi:2-phospho-L-lactate guanylyltransferase